MPIEQREKETSRSREAIFRSEGATPSERMLAQLADHSFLNLWSYPNLYRNQKVRGQGDGKELADLLVVCGEHLLIFSEKDIGWTKAEVSTAWCRWAKSALGDSCAQVKGAYRWITEHPDEIYLDKGCTKKFPLHLPDREQRKVHLIVVARGATAACKRFYGGGTGSFVINPEVCGDQHWNSFKHRVHPFVIGDINPDGHFVHVFDDASLDVVLRELDTISDFTRYLEKRSIFLRSSHLAIAHGEEDLLAYYCLSEGAGGEHDFYHPDGRAFAFGEKIAIDGSHFEAMLRHPQYLAKKRAERVSYIWDDLITNFTTHMLDGTSETPEGHTYDLNNSERAARYMAHESRFKRRAHGEAVVGAIQESAKRGRFFRLMLSTEGESDSETGFFVLIFPYLKWMEEKGGYTHYRKKRQELAEAYAYGALLRYRYLKRVVGVVLEPPKENGGSSEDLILVEKEEWTQEEEKEVESACARYQIFQDGFTERSFHASEFPAPPMDDSGTLKSQQTGLNRRARRAQARRSRKQSRSR